MLLAEKSRIWATWLWLSWIIPRFGNGSPLINSISIQYAETIKAFFPFAEFPFLLGSACLNVDITVTTEQTSSRIFSIWFGLSLFVEAGRIPWIPTGCYPLSKHFLPLLLMEGVLEVMKCKREGVLCRWYQNLAFYCTLEQADQDGLIGKRKLYR